MAAQRLNKRQLKRLIERERTAVLPYSRSQIANALHSNAQLNRQITAGAVNWLEPYLPADWKAWAEQVVPRDPQQIPPQLHCSIVQGMDMPLLQRFAAEVPESGNVYVHSLNDTQALVFNDAGRCFEARLQQGEIVQWCSSAQAPQVFETQLCAADAAALHAAWQRFAQEMNCPPNLDQFHALVFDAGLGSQRLVYIQSILLDWMDNYGNIHTQCRWFNGISQIMDGAEILHTMGHGRD